jgi:PKD repeat protein
MNASGSQSVSRAIAVGAVLVASFSFSPSSPIAGQAVQFTDTSTGTPSSWSWSFGDGSVSTLRNPTHAYAVAGLYPVSLTATAGSNSQTTILTVQVAPSTDLAASFSFSPSRPAPGQSISFTDTSSGEPTSWQWNFGDGSSSAVRDPSHAYAAVGTYNVTLITANASGSDTVSRSVVVAESAEALPAERVVDWTFSGVPGGIPARATVYRTMTPAQSAAEINAAIASCPAGQVVALAAGTYQLGQISFGSRSGVTLRGAGPGRTIIMTAASNAFTADEKYFFSEESIALANDAGLAKGSTWITLASAPTSAFAVGNLVMIDQADSPDALGSRGVGVYHRSGLTTPWNLDPTRCLRFTTRITGVSGTRISLATPVPYTFSQALSPRAMALRNGPGASQCGIEDLSIVGNGTSNRAVSLSGADRCWVKNVEASNFVATNGTIFIEGSSQCEVRRCYVHDCVGFPSQADGYAYFLYYGCGYCRIEDNIAYRNAYSILNGSAGNAVLYNYDIDARRAAHLFLEQSQICNHGPHGIMNLYEGNIVQRFQNDGYHGSTSHTTLFRNHVTGVSASVPSPTNRRLIDLCRGSYFHNVVGNIIGDASWTPSEYEYAPGEPVLSCVYILGFPGMDSGTMTAFTTVPWADWSKPTNAPDADVAATLLRHGNYDYLNRDTVWSEGIAARDLPASLVYSTKPAYFGTLQWPPIGPDVSGLVSDIPAKARWSAFMRSGNLGDLF